MAPPLRLSSGRLFQVLPPGSSWCESQFDGAAAEYGEAVRLRPASGRTHLDFASVLVAQGKMTQATEQLRLVAKSDDPEAARIAVAALQRLGQR